MQLPSEENSNGTTSENYDPKNLSKIVRDQSLQINILTSKIEALEQQMYSLNSTILNLRLATINSDFSSRW